MSLGLRTKILLISCTVFVTICLGVTWAASTYYSATYADTLQSRSLAIAKSLALQIERITALGIRLEYIVGFEEQCAEAAKAYSNVDYAMVLSQNGTILFHSDASRIGSVTPFRELVQALPRGEMTLRLPEAGEYLAIEPVRAMDDSQVASVVVSFSQHYIDESLNKLRASILAIGSGIAVLGALVLTLMLNLFITRPIKGLMTVIRHLRAHPGDYSHRVEATQRQDEIGALIGGVNQLLGEIEHREAELIRAKEMSDHANKAKSVFLAAMSHDLRTPMHAILSMNELMLSTQLNDRQRRFTNNIEKAGRWLLGIINDILEFAKIESGKLELLVTSFDLHVLIEDVVGLQEEIAHGKHLDLSYSVAPEVPRHVMGDGPRLMQILTNLISNAIRYTDQGSVRVEVLTAGAHTVFSVTDTGIGVDPEKIHLLWEPFVQVAAADGQRRSGTGLGLAIVKQLAEAMGGDVGVDTSPGNGATFWFTARLKAVEPETAEAISPA